jgi:hypothetical protein
MPLELHFKYGWRTSIVPGQGLFPSLDMNQLTVGILKALLAQKLHILPSNQTLRLVGWRALPQKECVQGLYAYYTMDNRNRIKLEQKTSKKCSELAFDADRDVWFYNNGEGEALKDEEALGSLYVMDKLEVKVSVSLSHSF